MEYKDLTQLEKGVHYKICQILLAELETRQEAQNVIKVLMVWGGLA